MLAGYPLVGLKATLYDGSYHPVDSNEMAFKTAAQLAYKEGIANANPTILEPIGELKVTIPDSYLGDVMGDLNKRRGRVMGMNPTDDGNQILEAEVPMAEMTSYAIDLRSITQSRGTFSFHFVRYEEAPPPPSKRPSTTPKPSRKDNPLLFPCQTRVPRFGTRVFRRRKQGILLCFLVQRVYYPWNPSFNTPRG